MFLIEKENGQIFEVYKSRKEFAHQVNMLTWSENGIWEDEDSALTLYYKDGSSVSYHLGDKKKPLKLNDVIKGHLDCGSQTIYNCEIVYNEKYEDWEIKED